MSEKITINRRTIFITIDKVKIPTNRGIEEKEDQFVVFFKTEEPNEISLGEMIRNETGSIAVFSSIQDARKYAKQRLESIVYPPDFMHPLKYTKENLSEIMHKKLKFDIGKANSDTTEYTKVGEIVDCSLAANSPNLPGNATIITENGEKPDLTFFEIKKISN